MALITFGIVFSMGAILSARFNVLILVLAIGSAVVGTGAVGIARGESVGAVMLTIALVAVAIQMGYLVALVARAAILWLAKPNRRAIGAEKSALSVVYSRGGRS